MNKGVLLIKNTSSKTFSRVLLVICAITLATEPLFAQLGNPEETPKSDPRVRAALNEASLKFTIDSDGDYRLRVSWNDENRSQTVFINSNTETYGNMEVREIWTYGATSDEGFSRSKLEELLKDNGRKKIGAWRLSQDGHKAIFKVVVSARANADTIHSVFRFVASVADELEKDWMGNDEL